MAPMTPPATSPHTLSHGAIEHWANVIALKSHCLTSIDLSGNEKAPLTAIKAVIKAAPKSLLALSFSGITTVKRNPPKGDEGTVAVTVVCMVRQVNALTVKEIGSLTSLTDLNLNAGPLKGLGEQAEEELIKVAGQLQKLVIETGIAGLVALMGIC